MKRLINPILCVCCFLLTASWSAASDLRVIDPWIREAPPGAKMLAAYMAIENNSDHVVTLTGATSPAFHMIEIHQTTVTQDMAQMTKQSDLQIKPGDTFEFKPSGYHLMLMQPFHALQAGDTVDIQIHLAGGETVAIQAVVRKQ